MKHLRAAVLTVCLAAVSVGAQAQADERRNELSFSYGFMPNAQWVGYLEKITGQEAGARFSDDSFLGPLSVEYFHHTRSKLSLGAVLVVAHNKQDIQLAGTTQGNDGSWTNNYVTVMPALKYDWMRNEKMAIYSKLALGATWRNESIDFDDKDYIDYGKDAFCFNWQASAIGFEYGSPTFRGFAELGVGEQGVVLAGIRFKL